MYNYMIATDTTADLPAEYLAEKEIPTFKLPYTIDEVTYDRDRELEYTVFYDKMRNGSTPTTSQVNPEEAKEGFFKLLEKSNNIIYIAFSSGLSGTYNSARLAAEEIMEDNPEANIKVVDSLCASMGEGLLVYKAAELRDKGASMDEVVDWLENNKLNLIHMFTVEDLIYLYRGGRVSRSTAFVGTVLSIKPVLHVDNEGHLVPIGKERGRKKSLSALVNLMGERMGSYKDKNDIFFISHGDCLEDALYVKKEVQERFGIENCVINNIGPTIGAHSGPGTVALFFLGETR